MTRPSHGLALAIALLVGLFADAAASDHWHWAFQAPVRPEAPAAGHPIDAFIDARLAAEGIEPLPEADPATLLRRLHLDLVGLLPSPEEAEAFAAEHARDPQTAFADAVDRLLASPHFGERWGRHWLDLSRYADSDGYLGDTERAWAWRYRDWVVDAVNRDLPYDRFSIEQIAGDLLPDATVDQRIATGFHRNALRNTEAGVDLELARTQMVIDRVNAVATTWLALTLACAECHNHKHDPLKQEEFYRVYAFFNNLDDADPVAPFPEETAKYERDRAAWDSKAKEFESVLAGETETLAGRQREWEDRLGPLPAAAWTALVPDKAESGASDEMSISDDGAVSVKAKKSDPDTVTYTLEAPWPEGLGTIAGVRLEALGSPGEGRVAGVPAGRGKDGAFALSDLAMQLRASDGSTRSLPLAEPKESWAVDEETRRTHAKVFGLGETVSAEEGARLVLTLRHKEGGGTTLRRFRLSATASEPLPPTELPDAVLAALSVAPEGRSEAQLSEIAAHYRSIDPAWSALRLAFDEHLAKAPAKPASKIQAVAERRAERRGSYVHVRGDYMRRGDDVSPGVPAVLHPLRPRPRDGEDTEPDRLDLAHWLFDDANPLTARVAANQIWQHLFGDGLVATPDDFGTEGAPPTHPELLDWLATEFRRVGWSRKALIRLIVSSQAYRRSSALPAAAAAGLPDPTDNTLLWRQNRYRVEAETVRDLHLAASGLLSRKLGGKPVRPPLPGFVTEVGRSVGWPESKGEDRYRRGLYIFLKRTVMYPSLTAFDAPGTEVACARRDRTQSPMQALTLLNDPVFFECAEALGRELAQSHADDADAAIDEIFLRCLARLPEPAERDALRSACADFARSGDAELALVGAARVVMNLDEFITRE